MASRYTIDEALEAILDDDFGLSDGDSSDEEGEDIYCYVGEPVLRRADVDILGGSIADGLLVDREDDSEVSSGVSTPGPTRACARVNSPRALVN